VTDTQRIAEALRRGGIIDITTTGRRSGQPRRIEIVFFNVEGRVYITGLPGSRAWMANLNADPHLTFHLKKGLTADLPATARAVSDEEERRAVLSVALRAWRREDQLEAFLAGSPLIEVVFDDDTLLAA
jgi:deazaflavin-dependent oxidoreductase (nitroreductase family)